MKRKTINIGLIGTRELKESHLIPDILKFSQQKGASIDSNFPYTIPDFEFGNEYIIHITDIPSEDEKLEVFYQEHQNTEFHGAILAVKRPKDSDSTDAENVQIYALPEQEEKIANDFCFFNTNGSLQYIFYENNLNVSGSPQSTTNIIESCLNICIEASIDQNSELLTLKGRKSLRRTKISTRHNKNLEKVSDELEEALDKEIESKTPLISASTPFTVSPSVKLNSYFNIAIVIFIILLIAVLIVCAILSAGAAFAISTTIAGSITAAYSGTPPILFFLGLTSSEIIAPITLIIIYSIITGILGLIAGLCTKICISFSKSLLSDDNLTDDSSSILNSPKVVDTTQTPSTTQLSDENHSPSLFSSQQNAQPSTTENLETLKDLETLKTLQILYEPLLKNVFL